MSPILIVDCRIDRSLLPVIPLCFKSKWNHFYSLKNSYPWLKLYKSVNNSFIKSEKRFLFELHSSTNRIVLHCQMSCARRSCTDIKLWICQINCSNINMMRTECQLRAKRVKEPIWPWYWESTPQTLLLEKAYWEQWRHLDVLRDYRFIPFDRTLNAKTYVHLPRANVTYLQSK